MLGGKGRRGWGVGVAIVSDDLARTSRDPNTRLMLHVETTGIYQQPVFF